jgi:hypothetical protein
MEKEEKQCVNGSGTEGNRNYGRFYALLHQLSQTPHLGGDAEEMKRDLVYRYTLHRTTSLREMTLQEYQLMCRTMEHLLVDEMARRKERSRVLRQMQRMGIETTNWSRVNAFCMDARIVGKPFGKLNVEELAKLRVKLYMIERHGGLEQVERRVGAEALKAMQ